MCSILCSSPTLGGVCLLNNHSSFLGKKQCTRCKQGLCLHNFQINIEKNAKVFPDTALKISVDFTVK